MVIVGYSVAVHSEQFHSSNSLHVEEDKRRNKRLEKEHVANE
jgi:hypothetical protein